MATYKGTTSDGLGVQATPAFAATQMGQRTIWDKIKLNYARNLKIIALFADGEISEEGLTKKAGMVSKWQVDSPRFESYNYTPPDITATVTADFTGTTLKIATANVKPYDTLFNGATRTNARVDSVTDANTCEVTSFGTTAFSASAGDSLFINATAYNENSSGPTIFSKDFDNVYNTLQIVREPVAISNSMLKSKFYATNDYFKLLKEINLINMMARVERSWLFGDRASGTGNTTAGGSAHSDSFRTTRGALNWAANTFDMKGNMTPFKFRTEVPAILTTVTESQKAICLGGYQTIGRIKEWMNAQAIYPVTDAKSALKEYGVDTEVVRTNNMPLELVTHQAFDKGGMEKTMLIFVPENNVFAYLKDRDIRPVVGIQNNDVDGQIDSVECEFGCGTIDGGASTLRVDNCW